MSTLNVGSINSTGDISAATLSHPSSSSPNITLNGDGTVKSTGSSQLLRAVSTSDVASVALDYLFLDENGNPYDYDFYHWTLSARSAASSNLYFLGRTNTSTPTDSTSTGWFATTESRQSAPVRYQSGAISGAAVDIEVTYRNINQTTLVRGFHAQESNGRNVVWEAHCGTLAPAFTYGGARIDDPHGLRFFVSGTTFSFFNFWFYGVKEVSLS